jgi:hypothetical protein
LLLVPRTSDLLLPARTAMHRMVRGTDWYGGTHPLGGTPNITSSVILFPSKYK